MGRGPDAQSETKISVTRNAPLRVGLPKGRLVAQSRALASRLGVDLHSRRYSGTANGFDIRLVKMRDIPQLLTDGILDAGVAPDEWVAEAGDRSHRVQRLCWYHAKICVIGRAGHRGGGTPTVATEYPLLAAAHFAACGIDVSIRTIHGSAEAYVPDLADFIVDCVETGETIVANSLRILDEIMACDVHVVVRPAARHDERLRSLIDAAMRVGGVSCPVSVAGGSEALVS